ncbi:glucose transporter type 1 isoform X1 [Eurytemora carolleeae]|uniref:glucose transporter type 1 isoform X1 n=2 Tax=Eurytemora carolleeae TaxID=1294199 RepID=UPI000C771B5F|nr:glucose transporter type 1 isoform X1 [Eurytemora carolleeae]|eukprot:XP_023331048.1 glucose transporter type 1-like isoform X1 [Eurytemora affinis]
MKNVTGTLVLSIFGAILGMFYFGYNTGVINAPEDSIKQFIIDTHKSHYNVTLTNDGRDAIYTLIVSMFVVGGMVGAMIGGTIADKLGRKRGLILSQVMGLLGGIITAISKPLFSWEVLLVGRLLVGFTAGLNTVVAPLYLSEIAPVNLRGGIGVLNQLAVTSGIFLSQILGLSEILGNEAGWAWLLAITAFPPALQLILLMFCPRSPRYVYISLEQEDEARTELYKLRKDDDVVNSEIREMFEEKQAEKEPDMNLWDIIKSSKLRVALTIGIVMHLSQQLSGIVAIFYYVVTFFTDAGIETNQAKVS